MTRLDDYDWPAVAAALDAQGWALLPRLLACEEAVAAAELYDECALFRSEIVMARHGFGRGTYRYFAYPLPPLVRELRTALYPRLAPIANRWHARMGLARRFPETHAQFLAQCHEDGQIRPTPLLLRYGPGDHN